MTDSLKGILLITLGTVAWGASGVVSEFLFTHKHFHPMDIIPIRCLFAGILLLIIHFFIKRDNIFKIFLSKDAIFLVVFSILGMLGIQYTFFQIIYYANAATATILQYLMPAVILFYYILKTKKMPKHKDIMSVTLAMIGTYILITKGDFTKLSISPVALFWGILCAIIAAFYTLSPKEMLKKWSASLYIGWAMTIAGILANIFYPFYNDNVTYDLENLLCLLIITVIGTALAFYGYLESTKYLNPTQISVFAALEPLSSIVLSFLFLGTSFSFFEILGASIIIVSITMLSN